jgi:hypothetical protein
MIASVIDLKFRILEKMVMYTLLGVLFVAVFGFLVWRIVMSQDRAAPSSDDLFICPICNEQHCECHKKNDARQ